MDLATFLTWQVPDLTPQAGKESATADKAVPVKAAAELEVRSHRCVAVSICADVADCSLNRQEGRGEGKGSYEGTGARLCARITRRQACRPRLPRHNRTARLARWLRQRGCTAVAAVRLAAVRGCCVWLLLELPCGVRA